MRNLVMSRTIPVLTVAAAALLALAAGTARAGGASQTKFSFTGENLYPAGTLCDFTLDDTFTVNGNLIFAPNGENPVTVTQHVTHTNLDTGYSLTEVDHFLSIANLSASPPLIMQAGIFWKLRDPSGKIVLVKAGELSFDPVTQELISFTPNSAADQTYAQIICPALGGSPA